MGQFAGKRVCGKPLKLGFLDMVRPNMQGECPGDYQPCNAGMTPDNIVCMPSRDTVDELIKECPILDFEIRKKSEFPNWRANALHKFDRPDEKSSGNEDTNKDKDENISENDEKDE